MPLLETLPETNAALTAISDTARSDDYDSPGAEAAPRWTGTVDGYIVEETLTVTTEAGPGRITEVVRTRLILPLEPAKDIKRGEEVTYEFDGAPYTRKVDDVRVSLVAGEVSLSFEDA